MTDSGNRTGVIVVNYNSGQWLNKCLQALSKQSHPPDRVIVVDNASSDESFCVDDDFNLPLEPLKLSSNVGFASANNLAAQRLQDVEWIVTLNPDAVVAKDWLAQLIATAADKQEYDFFGCQMLSEDRSTLDGVGDIYHSSGLVWRDGHGRVADDHDQHPGEIFSPCAAAAMYRRRCWEEAGGLDERYFCYVEDVDLGFRLRLLGYRCWYVPTAQVMHAGSAVSGSHSDFTVYHGHRNLVWTYIKNMPGWLLWLYLPQHLLLNFVTIAGFAMRGQLSPVLRAKRDALAALPQFWRDRAHVQANRRVSPGQLRHALTRGFAPLFRRRYRYQRPDQHV